MEATEKTRGVKRATVAGVLISVLAMALIFKFTETHLTWKIIYELNPFYIGLALVFHILFWIFWAYRLKILSSTLGNNIDFSYAFQTSLASGFLAAITPSSAGGEPLRVKMLTDRGMSVGASSAIVLAERLLDAIFFISALPVMVFISDFTTKFGIYSGVAFTIFFVLFIAFLYFSFKDPRNVEKLAAKLTSLAKKLIGKGKAERITTVITKELFFFREASVQLATIPKSKFAFLFAVTAVIWFSEFLVPSALLLALKTNPHWAESVASQLFLVIISLAPITPGSSGIAETGMFYFYSLFVGKEYLGSLVAIWRIITYHTNLLFGLVVNVKILKSRYLDR
ncbi:MAG: flippase-like domain-containing protein [Archaeoglobus sp.]|nr:flippase-like domain-containing protein [Archaeoglobus sp.]